MSWTLLGVLVAALGGILAVLLARRAELARMHQTLADRERARRAGSDGALLRQPVVDLSRCLGCGACVAACPEEGVLGMVHGQAVVVNGARCVGHAACERACPVGAVTVTIANLPERRDIPALTEGLEAVGSPGLFLAGEVTAHALIRTAVEQGTAIAAEVGRRASDGDPPPEGVLDLCIVGAGPAGLACALEAKRLALSFVVLEQEPTLGGTVAKYPRAKLVLTRPVDLPLHGRLTREAYTKEELIELWRSLAREHELPIRTGETLRAVERHPEGGFLVRTERGEQRARSVCLALGRRGVPRRLGVAGEELPKVAYSLLDARSHRGRKVLVVGGGDSAVETAVALAEQPGSEVTLSYRKPELFRIRARTEERLREGVSGGSLRLLLGSEVRSIGPTSVELSLGGGAERVTLENDEVFVMAGGEPPYELLRRSGVSFDPGLRPAAAAPAEQGTGLSRALAIGLLLALAALLFALLHADYYRLPPDLRPTHDKHALLRPGRGLGLALGIAAAVLVAANLLYLVRRSPRLRWQWGSLRAWMTVHVATGILAFLCALLHSAMAPGDAPGGHAFWALLVLLLSGVAGRYLYARVPRAANGRELRLSEAKARLARVSAEWDAGRRGFGARAREAVSALVERRQWRAGFLGRLVSLFGAERDLRRTLRALAADGRRAGVAPGELAETLSLARRAHSAALMAARFEELRAVLGSWRWVHRWVALLMVLLVLLHVVHALLYGFQGGGS